jgi:hypothetical protein
MLDGERRDATRRVPVSHASEQRGAFNGKGSCENDRGSAVQQILLRSRKAHGHRPKLHVHSRLGSEIDVRSRRPHSIDIVHPQARKRLPRYTDSTASHHTPNNRIHLHHDVPHLAHPHPGPTDHGLLHPRLLHLRRPFPPPYLWKDHHPLPSRRYHLAHPSRWIRHRPAPCIGYHESDAGIEGRGGQGHEG